MYKMETGRFGEIDVDEEKIFDFKNGILAFEESKKFIILNSAKESFFWLQSVDDPKLSLPCINPDIIAENYEVNLSDEQFAEINVDENSEMIVLCVVRIPENIRESTVNLIAPIIINATAKQGMQVVMENTDYNVRHRLFE